MQKKYILSSLALLLGICAAVFGAGWTHAAQADGDLDAVWARVQQSGAYAFKADIAQASTPLATVLNAGSQRVEDSLYLEGETDINAESLHLMLWSDGGSAQIPGTGTEVQVNGDTARARQGDGPWEAIEDFTGLFAPGGDFLSYTQAAEKVVRHAPEVRTTPLGDIEMVRYTFDVNGRKFAIQMHDHLREQAMREGLPATVPLDLPRIYADMTGSGELWVGPDGLPLRQTFTLEFPPDADEYVTTAAVTVDFSDFAPLPVTGAAIHLGDRLRDGLREMGMPQNALSLLAAALSLGLVALVVLRRRSKAVYASVVGTILLSMLVTPVLTGQKVAAYSQRQEQKRADRDEEMARQEAVDALQAQLRAAATEPHADPLTAAQRAAVAAPTFQDTTAGRYFDASCESDPEGDMDGDGLTNLSECLLGTLPGAADTDSDGIPDTLEIEGFSYNSQSWYTDPLSPDTNQDGIGDGREWYLDVDGNELPDDTDGDGTPDLWDDDNDGDGVRDSLDLSPYTTTKAQDAFTESNPFQLSFNDLTEDEYVRVEFQLRPTEAGHLWYSQSVLDWPVQDRQGQIQDADGQTFYDIDHTLPRQPNMNGDMRLIPMLEIEIAGSETNLPSQDILSQLGIAVQQSEDQTQTTVYVPVQLVSDSVGNANVAFYARMLYKAGAEWGSAHQVSLIWMVQMLNDICAEYVDGICTEYKEYNQPQVIQTYDEAWYVTGLHIMEEHSADVTIIYEDPQETPNIQPGLDDAPLYMDTLYGLLQGLDYTFLAGSDCDSADANGNCVGNGQLDVTVDTLGDRFNHATNSYDVNEPDFWGLPNVLNVMKNGVQRTANDGLGSYADIPSPYASMDLAMLDTTITQTVGVLNANFTAHWSQSNPITPTLMLAYQQTYRDLNLDQMLNNDPNLLWSGSGLTLDMPQSGPNVIEPETMTSVKWTPYAYDVINGWGPADLQAYWETMNRDLVTSFDDVSDPTEAGSLQTMAQSVYLSAYSGFNNIVQRGDTILIPDYQKPSTPLFLTVTKQVGKITKEMVKNYFKYSDTLAAMAFRIQKMADRTETSVASSGVAYFKQQILDWWQTPTELTDIVKGTFMVVAGAAALFGLAVEYGLSHASDGLSLAGKISASAGVGSIMTYMTLYKPIRKVYTLSATAVEEGATWGEAIGDTLAARSTILGAGREAGVFGLVLSIELAIGMFAYVWASGDVSPGTIAFDDALAQTIAGVIVAVLLYVLSLFTIGAILVAMLALIDTVLTLAGTKFTITGAVTKWLAGIIYSYDLDTTQSVTSGLDVTLLQPDRGVIAGNTMSQTLQLTTTLQQSSPASEDRLRSNSLVYELDVEKKALSTSTGARSNDWNTPQIYYQDEYQNVYFRLYETYVVDHPGVTTTLSAGVNSAVPLYLNSAYALRGQSCWVGFCSDKSLSGYSTDALGDLVVLDVLPATLSEFVDVSAWGTVGFLDADGDGMMAYRDGGLDPDDSTWDLDQDGLSDAYEVTLGNESPAAGGLALDPHADDTDGDGLNDYAELRSNTDPSRADTDGDGLTDLEEALLIVDASGALGRNGGSGWLIPYAYDASTKQTRQTRVYSDPQQRDGDADGMTDLFEQAQTTLTNMPWADPTDPRVFNPNVWSESPVALYLDDDSSDGFVKPGASVVYTTTTANNLSSGQELAGKLTLDLPGGASGAPLSQEVDISSGQRSSLVSTLQFDRAQTAAYEFSSRMALTDYDQTRWVWEEVAEASRGALGGTPRAIAVAFVSGWEATYVMVTQEQSQTGESINAYTVQLDGTVLDAVTLSTSSTSVDTRYTAPDIICNNDSVCLVTWGAIDEEGAVGVIHTARLANGLHSPSTASLTDSFPLLLAAPTVATDGTDFMVAWGEPGNSNGSMQYYTASVPNTGSASSPLPLGQGQSGGLTVNIEWTGTAYLTVWANGDTLERATVDTNGSVSNNGVIGPGGGWFQSNGNMHTPALSYDAISNQSLLVYRSDSGSMVAHILTADSTGDPFTLVQSGVDGEDVSVALSADTTNGGWILAWSAAETLEYRAISPGGSLRSDIAASSQTALTSVALSCMRPQPILDLALDERAGATLFSDASPSDLTATCGPFGGCPQAGSASDRGNAVSFDGTTSLEVQNGINLANRSFTLSAWLKNTETGKYGTILGQGTPATNQGLSFGFHDSQGTFTCQFYGNDLYTVEQYPDTDWHHWVCTYDVTTGERIIYRDGLPVSTTYSGVSTGAYTGSGPLVIGHRYEGAKPLTGLLQEVVIYDRALTASEVSDIFDQPLAVYDLDEAQGSQQFVNAAVTGFNGQCSGSTCPTLGVTGVSYTAAHFDGVDDFIVIPAAPEVDTAYQWTFEDGNTSNWYQLYTVGTPATTTASAVRNSAETQYLVGFDLNTQTLRGLYLDLVDLPPHDQINISYDLYVVGNQWAGTGLYQAYSFPFTLSGPSTLLNTTFSNQGTGPGQYQLYPADSGSWNDMFITLYENSNCAGSPSYTPGANNGDTQPVPDSTQFIPFNVNCVDFALNTAAILYTGTNYGGTRYVLDPGSTSNQNPNNQRIGSFVLGPAAYAPKHGSTGESLVINGNGENSIYSLQSTMEHSDSTLTLDFQANNTFGLDNVKLDVVKSSNSLALRDSSFTVAAWVKRDTNGVEEWIMTQGMDEQDSGLFFGFRDTDHFTCALYQDDLDTAEAYSDTEWHHWACTFDAATKQRTIYYDGNQVAQNTTIAPYQGRGATYLGRRFDSNGQFFTGTIDEVGIWSQALTGDQIQELYQKVKVQDNSVLICQLPLATGQAQLQMASLELRETATPLGDISQTITRTLTVDNDKPTIAIQTLRNGQYVSGADLLSIGGTASDPTSYIAGVQVRSDSGDSTWEAVAGKSTWAYNWDPDGLSEGQHTVQVQAVDAVGNEGAAASVAFVLDRTAPTVSVQTGTDASTDASAVQPTQDDAGRWYVPLRGSVSDPDAGGQSGSGATSVEVLLQGQQVQGQQVQGQQLQGQQLRGQQAQGQQAVAGNGWQPATLSGNSWTLAYALPLLGEHGHSSVDPSGLYTATLRASDAVSNTTAATNYPTSILTLDVAGPVLSADQPLSSTTVISTALTLGGAVSDFSPVSAVEVNLTPAGQIDALNGNVLHLPMDENRASHYVDDQSGTGHDATCSGDGCPTVGQPGQRDGAFRFDGTDDALDAGDAIAELAKADFSMGVWVKTTGTAMGLFTKSNDDAIWQAGEKSFYLDDSGVPTFVGWGNEFIYGTTAVNDNAWHHLLVTWEYSGSGTGDSNTAGVGKIYVDGVDDTAATTDYQANYTDNADSTLKVGHPNDHEAPHFFNGLLDEVIVYSRALAAYEVENLYAYGQGTWDAAGVSNGAWSYTLPAGANGIEGIYQINVRGTDVFSNTTPLGAQRLWRGEIDTRPPTVQLFVTSNDSGTTPSTTYECIATDFNLLQESDSNGYQTTSCVPGFSSAPTFRNSDLTLSTYDSVDPWYAATITDTSRLYGMDGTTTYAGNPVDDAETTACDRYNRCTTVPAEPRLTAPGMLAGAEVLSPTSGTVLTGTAPVAARSNTARNTDQNTEQNAGQAPVEAPVQATVLHTVAPITVTGDVYAHSGLHTLSVSVNGSVAHQQTWETAAVTADLWRFRWTPPGEGVYRFESQIQDWADKELSVGRIPPEATSLTQPERTQPEQAQVSAPPAHLAQRIHLPVVAADASGTGGLSTDMDLFLPFAAAEGEAGGEPIRGTHSGTVATLFVDLTPPEVTLETIALTPADDLGRGIFELAGTASDSVWLYRVDVRIDDGPWQRAGIRNDGTWQLPWALGPVGDTATYQISVRATDLAGRTTTVSELVTVAATIP